MSGKDRGLSASLRAAREADRAIQDLKNAERLAAKAAAERVAAGLPPAGLPRTTDNQVVDVPVHTGRTIDGRPFEQIVVPGSPTEYILVPGAGPTPTVAAAAAPRPSVQFPGYGSGSTPASMGGMTPNTQTVTRPAPAPAAQAPAPVAAPVPTAAPTAAATPSPQGGNTYITQHFHGTPGPTQGQAVGGTQLPGGQQTNPNAATGSQVTGGNQNPATSGTGGGGNPAGGTAPAAAGGGSPPAPATPPKNPGLGEKLLGGLKSGVGSVLRAGKKVAFVGAAAVLGYMVLPEDWQKSVNGFASSFGQTLSNFSSGVLGFLPPNLAERIKKDASAAAAANTQTGQLNSIAANGVGGGNQSRIGQDTETIGSFSRRVGEATREYAAGTSEQTDCITRVARDRLNSAMTVHGEDMGRVSSTFRDTVTRDIIECGFDNKQTPVVTEIVARASETLAPK